jgi:hypothetical protein
MSTSIHLDMKPSEMFPETGETTDKATLANMFMSKEPDSGPREQWLFRLTNELTPADVLRLFQTPAHLVTRKILASIDELYGKKSVRLLETGIPGVDVRYVHPKHGRLRRLAVRFAEKSLDMVPRAELQFERDQNRNQLQARANRAALEAVINIVGELRDIVVDVENRIFPGVKAATREGASWRGDRCVAVWGGVDAVGRVTEPTGEPEF